MSDGYAIAAVTAVLRRTILEALSAARVSDVVGTVPVTSVPPDRVLSGGAPEPSQINIFLHQVSLNTAMRNVSLPTRSAAGSLVSGPLLPLDLHYLVTAYGTEPFQPEMLMGHAALALHENATLTREAIRRALSPQPPDPLVPPILASCGLDGQIEMIHVLPQPVDGEEMSRLWSAIQGQYRPTLAYRVSVVLIEPRAAGVSAPPVRSPQGMAVAASSLRLDTAGGSSGPADPVTPATALVARGQGFVPGETHLEIGGVVATPAPEAIGASRIEVDLSGLTDLRAGLHGVRAVRTRAEPAAPVTPVTDVSNAVAVAVRPVIAGMATDVAETDTADGVPVASGTLTVTFGHAVGRDQSAAVLLNVAGGPGTRRLRAPANNGAGAAETVTEIGFAFARLPRGPWLVRASIDGADSVLKASGDVYDGPEVTV